MFVAKLKVTQNEFFNRHSGLDPESSFFFWIPAFEGIDTNLWLTKEYKNTIHSPFGKGG
jgi:hypothetical protein